MSKYRIEDEWARVDGPATVRKMARFRTVGSPDQQILVMVPPQPRGVPTAQVRTVTNNDAALGGRRAGTGGWLIAV